MVMPAKKVSIEICEGEVRKREAYQLKEILERKGYEVKIFISERDEREDNVLDTDSVVYDGIRISFFSAYKHAEELF